MKNSYTQGCLWMPIIFSPIKPISSHAHDDIWAKHLRTINACSNTMAVSPCCTPVCCWTDCILHSISANATQRNGHIIYNVYYNYLDI